MKINRFRINLFLLTSAFLVIPVISCCVILFTITENTLKTYTSNSMDATLKENVQNIESKLDILDKASRSLLLNLATIREVTDSELHTKSVDIFCATKYDFTVSSSLIVDTYTINGFSNFYLYFPKRSLLIVSKITFFENVPYNTMDCITIPQGTWGVSNSYDNLICNPILGKFMTSRNISQNYNVTNELNPKEDIILTANIKEDYISDQLSRGFQFKPNRAIVIDSHGNVISSLENAEIGSSVPAYHQMLAEISQSDPADYHEITIDGVKYMFNWEYSPEKDWYYITTLDVNVVTNSISSIVDFFFVMVICLLAVSLVITLVLVQSITNPLNNLTSAMKEMKNKNFKIQLAVQHGDEFEVIYNGFNEMAQEIGTLVHTITEKNNLNTETNIRLLQSEINPHMLYNSLESLYSMAKINEQEEISDLVMAMSKFFRISLSGGKRLVPLREAFELANQYIIVQNIRLNYKIRFEYNIPESLMNLLTPKFLLQPVVENTFQHGFKNRRENCSMTIEAHEEEDCIIIVVWDNGIGIHESDLELLNRNISNFDFEGKMTRKGYALRNVNYQLKLEFGDAYGLWLESVYGEYTRVIIKIPKLKKED